MSYRRRRRCPTSTATATASGLRGHLRMLAAEEGATVDWSTLHVSGPEEVVGRHGVTWYEWTATDDRQNEPARYR